MIFRRKIEAFRISVRNLNDFFCASQVTGCVKLSRVRSSGNNLAKQLIEYLLSFSEINPVYSKKNLIKAFLISSQSKNIPSPSPL